jgi:NitT/TauT family transport system permease protein
MGGTSRLSLASGDVIMPDSMDSPKSETPAAQSSYTVDLPPEETFYQAHEPVILGAGFIVLVLASWELYPVIFGLSKGTQLFFAAPSDVVGALYNLLILGEKLPMVGTIWDHFNASTGTFLFGLGLSIIVALPLGVALGRSQTVDAIFDPFITAFNATPRLVFLPIVLIWFGVGFWTVIAIVFMGAVFPLLINTYAGVKNADRLLINVVRSFGANEWQINKLVVLPNSLPFIIAGLRLAIGRAILGVVVAEFFGGTEFGLGVVMVQASQGYRVDILFAVLIIFMAVSLLITAAVKQIENRLSRWRPAKVKTF